MSIYSIICLIIIQIISGHFEYVREDSSTRNIMIYPAKTWQSETNRTKRSIYDEMLYLLEMHIQLEEGLIINVKLIKQLPNLANKYLPVIGNYMNPFKSVMDDVGEFVMYQDIENCIAIIYFHNFGSFYGVIGLNHHIADLPYNFDTNGKYRLGLIGKPYVDKNNHQFHHINPIENYPPPSDTKAWEDFLRPFNYSSTENQRQPTSEQKPSTSRQNRQKNNLRTSRQYYVETLVLVTRDLADYFKAYFGEEGYVAGIVRYHIIYFNAINMILKKLSTLYSFRFGVTINMAKIVIEGGSTSFGFETGSGLQFTDVTTKLPQFFSNHPHLYAQNSFDYVFVHTSLSIFDGNIVVNAISKYGQDMVEGKKTGRFYETIPITVAKLKTFYAHYAIAAHEIARTLGVKITPKQNGFQNARQCHSIMQRDGPKCNICLAWTVENFHQIYSFFSWNRNRCFLLNYPRSLHPPVIIKMLTPNEQCQCQGYDSYLKSQNGRVRYHVRFYDCSIPLRCQIERGNQIFYEDTFLPLDGTPCTNKKVCWNEECQDIGSYLTNTSQK